MLAGVTVTAVFSDRAVGAFSLLIAVFRLVSALSMVDCVDLGLPSASPALRRQVRKFEYCEPG